MHIHISELDSGFHRNDVSYKPFPGSSCRRKSARSAIQLFLMIVLSSYGIFSQGLIDESGRRSDFWP